MSMDTIQTHGVVGAGRGRLPHRGEARHPGPHLSSFNGAECEPLLHKDKELMKHQAEPMLRGLQVAMEARRRPGSRDRHQEQVRRRDGLPEASAAHRRPHRFPLTDTYPAGDEFILVHDVTGKVIPPGGLPKDVGTAVANIETLVNIGLDRPVTHKYLTVAGAVKTPVTLRVPVGLSLGEAIEAAGGATGRSLRHPPGRRDDGPPGQRAGRAHHQDHGGNHRPAHATHPLVLRHGAKYSQIARWGARPATSAASAPRCARAT